MSNSKTTSVARHWPALLLGVMVGAVLIFAIFSFQVNETQVAVVTTFGRVEQESPTAGLHFRWPYPIQKVYKFDKRSRTFSGTVGSAAEEMLTKDGKNIVVSVFVVYNISDSIKFFEQLTNIETAEQRLNDLMRSAKSSTLGRYDFEQLINVDPKDMELTQIGIDIQNEIQTQADKFGITIKRVGIKSLNVPGQITDKIFERMIKEREVKAQVFRSQGEKAARNIRTEAQKNSSQIVTEAEAKAREIRAEGDAKAAEYYAEFQKNPELAEFLRSLDAMRQILRTRTTLVLDTDTPPFNLLNPGAVNSIQSTKSTEKQ